MVSQDVEGLRFGDMLFVPIQRIPKYRLMLSAMLEHLSTSDPSYPTVVKAVRLIEDIALAGALVPLRPTALLMLITVNERKRHDEQLRGLLSMHPKVATLVRGLIQPHRTVVCEWQAAAAARLQC